MHDSCAKVTPKVAALGHWEYFAEGGAHVVFRIVDGADSQWGRRHVLKVPKLKDGHNNDHHTNFLFLANTIGRWFEKHDHRMEMVELSPEELRSLELSARSRRCPSRAATETIFRLSPSALLEDNLCHIDIPPSLEAPRRVVSFELKVKCGLKASSPFLDPEQRVKVDLGKFSWMQHWKMLHCQQTNSSLMPWGELTAHSEYSPSALCSGDPSQVVTALRALWSCPQNNLKVSLDGEHCYGWDRSDPSALLHSLSALHGGCDAGALLEEHLRLLAQILCREGLLQRLELLQCADLLDTEGCHFVACELQARLGSAEAVEHQLLRHFGSPIELENWEALASVVSQHSKGPVSGELAQKSSPLPPLAELALLRVDGEATTVEREQMRRKARSAVTQMRSEQLLELLKMSMAAMVAKDASVIVSVQTTGAGAVDTLPLVACGGDGLIREADPRPAARYRMGVIDVSLKAVSKFHTNLRKEREVLAAVERSLAARGDCRPLNSLR